MKTILLAKAGVTREEIDGICIEISGEIPELPFDTMNHFYNLEAGALYKSLIATLPQATIDRLTIKLLEQQASLLKTAIKGP